MMDPTSAELSLHDTAQTVSTSAPYGAMTHSNGLGVVAVDVDHKYNSDDGKYGEAAKLAQQATSAQVVTMGVHQMPHAQMGQHGHMGRVISPRSQGIKRMHSEAMMDIGGAINPRPTKRNRRLILRFSDDEERKGEKPFGSSASRRSEAKMALLRAFEKYSRGKSHNAACLLRDFLDHADMKPILSRVMNGITPKEMVVHKAIVAGLRRKLKESASCSTKDRIRRSAIADAALSNIGEGSEFPKVTMGKVAQALGMRYATLQTWNQELSKSTGGFIEKRKTRSDATPQDIKDLVMQFYQENTRAAPDALKYVIKRRVSNGTEEQHRVHWREVTFEKLFERFKMEHHRIKKVGLSTFKKLCPWWVRAKTPKPAKNPKPTTLNVMGNPALSAAAAAAAAVQAHHHPHPHQHHLTPAHITAGPAITPAKRAEV